MKKLGKTLMKTIRYIRQDAPPEQLEMIRRLLTNAIDERKHTQTK